VPERAVIYPQDFRIRGKAYLGGKKRSARKKRLANIETTPRPGGKNALSGGEHKREKGGHRFDKFFDSQAAL